MNTVIFARGYNIAGQVEFCREYAESKGYNVESVVVGQGQDLPAIIGGLGGKIDRVIVRDMARINRNALEGYAILAELELDYGVTVEVATANITNEVEQRFMTNIIKAVKENDMRQRIKLRSRMEL